MKPKQICEVVKNGKLTAEQAKELLDFAGENSHAFAEIMLLLKDANFSTGVNAKIQALFDEVVSDYEKLVDSGFSWPELETDPRFCIANANAINIQALLDHKTIQVKPIYVDAPLTIHRDVSPAIRPC